MTAKVSGLVRFAGMGLRVPPVPTRNCCIQQLTGTEPKRTRSAAKPATHSHAFGGTML